MDSSEATFRLKNLETVERVGAFLEDRVHVACSVNRASSLCDF